ncbi:ribosome biogenesis protein BRX1-like protein [Cucumis melo var. makuwa]|uniref:Ribosome biogenesis protein BRX1-like protein n=1 Tax=Cucumis melo var. makuwa TaxID=1194695 RepID=A0A5A7SQ25_CUCMM|nr:ribosome biogenesis protein BRX1-like protein [Cucumis melo var. makuwa]
MRSGRLMKAKRVNKNENALFCGPKQKERISMAKGCSFSKNRCNEFNDFGTNRGPTAKYLNPSFLTSPFFAFSAMEELKLIGNYLKGSRPILTFSSNFDKDVLWKLMKEMIIQVPMAKL